MYTQTHKIYAYNLENIKNQGYLIEQFLQKIKGTWTTETSKGYRASAVTEYGVAFATIHKGWTGFSVGSEKSFSV